MSIHGDASPVTPMNFSGPTLATPSWNPGGRWFKITCPDHSFSLILNRLRCFCRYRFLDDFRYNRIEVFKHTFARWNSQRELASRSMDVRPPGLPGGMTLAPGNALVVASTRVNFGRFLADR